MVRASFKVLGCRAQAEECASDVVAELLADPPVDVQNPEAFVVTVARRRAIDRYRAEVSARKRLDRYSAGEMIVTADIAEGVAERDAASWADGQARALLTQRGYAVLRMVAAGVAVPEIARALTISERAVEGHLRRARMIMRSALAKALALLGLALSGLRRGFGSCAPTTATLAALALFIALPVLPTSPDEGLRLETPKRETMLPSEHVESASGSAHEEGPKSAASRTPTPRRSPEREAQLQTPLVGVGTYEKDDGYQADGPVDLILHCVDNLHVDTHSAGCDESSHETDRGHGEAPPSRG